MLEQWFTKQPSEKYTIGIEFRDKLPPATNLSLGTVTAYRLDTMAVDNSVLDITAAIITGTQAKIIVKAGTSGISYKLSFVCTLNEGSILEEDVRMDVVEL